MAHATAVVQMVSRLNLSPPISRVTCSPTGMLIASTLAALNIVAARLTYLPALVTSQGDHAVQEHHGLEDRQARDHAPTEGRGDHQQPDGHRGTHAESEGHAAGEGLA